MAHQQRKVMCPENEGLASFLLGRRDEMAEKKAISENLELIIYKAYSNICDSKNPLRTLKEVSQVKGVGKWIIHLLQGYFRKDSEPSQSLDSENTKKKGKESKRYIPQKNSAAYALLVTLYRGTMSGKSFMGKQELIDATESSGLSKASIGLEKSDGKPGSFGNSGRDWYCGWNRMKSLITKGLIVKSSNPAKYMLTEEGKEAACECLARSGIADCEALTNVGMSISARSIDASNTVTSRPASKRAPKDSAISSTTVSTLKSDSRETKKKRLATTNSSFSQISQNQGCLSSESETLDSATVADGTYMSVVSDEPTLRPCSLQPCTFDFFLCKPVDVSRQPCSIHSLAMPPGMPGESFGDLYDVILILDDREQFGHNKNGSHSKKVVESISSQFKLLVEVRRLPVGDGIWIARHRYDHQEYVLDFIVERKKVNDLRQSIRDNRYKDQKLRLLRCGLQKLIYLVEGDPNSSEAAESIKTACFTTEILEGFDVHRTSGLFDTVKKYGYLTQSITSYYRLKFPGARNSRACPTYDDFARRCENLEKLTITDVFAVQLMQVPQVTEDTALAVVDMYPTLLALARAYSLLGNDVRAAEEMLSLKSKLIGKVASKNIFNFIWSS
ncbi:Crossover junction endonuclease [Nymphaea thermarum]|nr:Crossover junction endonuclease [Nymphaea thermarum]